jgi:hypothetical protein
MYMYMNTHTIWIPTGNSEESLLADLAQSEVQDVASWLKDSEFRQYCGHIEAYVAKHLNLRPAAGCNS